MTERYRGKPARIPTIWTVLAHTVLNDTLSRHDRKRAAETLAKFILEAGEKPA